MWEGGSEVVDVGLYICGWLMAWLVDGVVGIWLVLMWFVGRMLLRWLMKGVALTSLVAVWVVFGSDSY